MRWALEEIIMEPGVVLADGCKLRLLGPDAQLRDAVDRARRSSALGLRCAAIARDILQGAKGNNAHALRVEGIAAAVAGSVAAVADGG